MKRPLAYVTAAWRGGECEVMEQAAPVVMRLNQLLNTSLTF